MNTRLILATLAGGVIFFLLGWLVFGILLMDFYQANITEYPGLWKEMPNLVLIALANLVFAFLLAFIFQRWAGITTFGRGFLSGLLVTVLIMLVFDIWMFAGMNLFKPVVLVVDVLVNTLMGGIVGGVIGWILGTGRKKEA